MPHIPVDDKTLSGLEAVAKAKGLSVGGYLQSLVEQEMEIFLRSASPTLSESLMS